MRLTLLLFVLTGCGTQPPPLSSAQVDEIQVAASDTAHCRQVGREADSYSAYDCCMRAVGLHPGPRCVPDAGGRVEFGNYIPPTDGGKDGPDGN